MTVAVAASVSSRTRLAAFSGSPADEANPSRSCREKPLILPPIGRARERSLYRTVEGRSYDAAHAERYGGGRQPVAAHPPAIGVLLIHRPPCLPPSRVPSPGYAFSAVADKGHDFVI